MSDTPLTDFLATLADPATLDRFRADPAATAAAAGLSEELIAVVLGGHTGAIRVKAIQELERAGLAPLVSDKFVPYGRTISGIPAPAQGSIPVTDKGAKAARASIFPISIPPIPASAFPITSQEDLVAKMTRLFLRPPFPKNHKSAAQAVPAGARPGEARGETVDGR